jgi:DNA invertase Pin-like site-specific DNA recombinase
MANMSDLDSNKTVLIYARALPGASDEVISNQVAICMGYVNQRPGYTCVGYVTDNVAGDTAFDSRKAGHKAMRMALEGDCDAIMFYDTDAFYNTPAHALSQAQRLNEMGIDVIFVDLNIDTTTEDGVTQLTRKAKMSDEHIKALRLVSTTRGAIRDDEQYINSGDRSRNRADAHAFKVAEDLIAATVRLHRSGKPFTQLTIADEFNLRKIPTLNAGRKESSGRWTSASIRKLITRLEGLGHWNPALKSPLCLKQNSYLGWLEELGLIQNEPNVEVPFYEQLDDCYGSVANDTVANDTVAYDTQSDGTDK